MRKHRMRQKGEQFRHETSAFLSRALANGLDPVAALRRLAEELSARHEAAIENLGSSSSFSVPEGPS